MKRKFSQEIWIGQKALHDLVYAIGAVYEGHRESEQEGRLYMGCELLAECLLALSCSGHLRFAIVRSRPDKPDECFRVPGAPGWPDRHHETVLSVTSELAKGGSLSVKFCDED